MKKYLLILAALLMVLCAGTAMAASHPCDVCDGETRLISSGSWCHWYCESCDYTTSRNHDPNSAYSGLVPDSCSGSCSWCGAAADYSSHTFAGYVYNGDATCDENGTETGKCTNVQCDATNTRTSADTALGHDFRQLTYAPTCTDYGVTTYICKVCDLREYKDYVEPLGHSHTNWSNNGDGTHTAVCDREGCSNTVTEPCQVKTVIVGGKEIRFCFVCSHMENASSADDAAKPLNINGLMVLVDPAPLETELDLGEDFKVDVLYMFIIGSAKELDAKVKLIIDLKKHPFEMTEGDYVSVLPEELDAEKLSLFYVGADQTAVTAVETWYPYTFLLEEGVLTFETDELGVYLLTTGDPLQ